MTSQGVAVGVAFLFSFLGVYGSYLYATIKNKDAVQNILERAQKYYLFGALTLISIHFNGTWAAVFSWFTMIAFVWYITTGLSDNKKMTSLSGMIFFILLSIWTFGKLIIIFDRVHSPNWVN